MPTRDTDTYIREAAILIPPGMRLAAYLPTGVMKLVTREVWNELCIRDPRGFVDLTRKAVAQAASAYVQALATGASVGAAPGMLR